VTRPTPSPALAAESAALQALVAGEHAAVHAYGVAGAWLAGAQRQRAARYRDAHRLVRDELSALVDARGVVPVAALAGYALPFPVDGAAAARRLTAEVEDRLAALHADLVVAAASAAVRSRAVAEHVGCARRALAWGAAAAAFPGLPERQVTG
jgi:hypothetical protein